MPYKCLSTDTVFPLENKYKKRYRNDINYFKSDDLYGDYGYGLTEFKQEKTISVWTYFMNQSIQKFSEYPRLNRLFYSYFSNIYKETVQTGLSDSDDLNFDILLLDTIYSFRNRSEILQFLKNNVFLIPLLYEINSQIKEYFPLAKNILEVINDPDTKDNVYLVIFIHTDITAREAFNRLKLFDESWWLRASIKANKKLFINVEFDDMDNI